MPSPETHLDIVRQRQQRPAPAGPRRRAAARLAAARRDERRSSCLACAPPPGRARDLVLIAALEKGWSPGRGPGSCPPTRYQPRDKVRIASGPYSVQNLSDPLNP